MADRTRRVKCGGCGAYGHSVETCVSTIERTTGMKGIYLQFVFDSNTEVRVTVDNAPFAPPMETMVFTSTNGATVIVKQIAKNHFGLYGGDPMKINFEQGTDNVLKAAWADCALSIGERFEIKNNHMTIRTRVTNWIESIVRNPRGVLRFKALDQMFVRPIKVLVFNTEYVILKREKVWVLPMVEWLATTALARGIDQPPGDEAAGDETVGDEAAEPGNRMDLQAIMPPNQQN